MTRVEINGVEYLIEFRHVAKVGKHRQLFDRAPIRAVTTCVIATDTFIAIDNAICANEDNFSRRQGRIKALQKVIKHCGALRDVAPILMNWYLTTVDPAPAMIRIHTPLTDADKRELIRLGEQTRNERKVRRAS